MGQAVVVIIAGLLTAPNQYPTPEDSRLKITFATYGFIMQDVVQIKQLLAISCCVHACNEKGLKPSVKV